MRLKLTDVAIANLEFQHPQATYYDTLLPAFGVRVGSRSKTFIVMHGKSRKRETIGKYPTLKLSEARDKARKFLAAPGTSQQSQSLSEAVTEYLDVIKLRGRTHYE